MRLFHRSPDGGAILASGFQDATATYMTTNEYTGVWFSDGPLDINEGAPGDWLLTIDLDERAIEDFEWIEEGKGYREWLVPAGVANAAGPPTVVERPRAEDQLRTRGTG